MIAQSHMYKIEDVLCTTVRFHSGPPVQLILMEIVIKDSCILYVQFLSYREQVIVSALTVQKIINCFVFFNW